MATRTTKDTETKVTRPLAWSCWEGGGQSIAAPRRQRVCFLMAWVFPCGDLSDKFEGIEEKQAFEEGWRLAIVPYLESLHQQASLSA